MGKPHFQIGNKYLQGAKWVRSQNLRESFRLKILDSDQVLSRLLFASIVCLALPQTLPVFGTLGVLERADGLNLVVDFSRVLQRRKESGFFISESLEEDASSPPQNSASRITAR
jgi:hypothetical protein